ncbi:hypothetical protein Tco_0635526 [Tanacetum coccineum]
MQQAGTLGDSLLKKHGKPLRIAQLVETEVVRVKIPKCLSWLDAYDGPIGDLDRMEDKIDNQSPQSTPQVLPSFEVYTPSITYPEEVEETLGTPMEVEPLNKTQPVDLGLNSCNNDIPLSSKEIPIFDEPEPQPQPLSNCPPLYVRLGEERGPEPPIKPHSLDSFRIKEIFQENKIDIFTECEDGVRIFPDGVASPESTLKVSLYTSYLADFTPGVVVFVFDLQVIFDKKKLGSS